MAKPKPWRVRVRVTHEDWVEVVAENGPQAEGLAANKLGVVGVFKGSAIPGDLRADAPLPQGVEEENL